MTGSRQRPTKHATVELIVTAFVITVSANIAVLELQVDVPSQGLGGAWRPRAIRPLVRVPAVDCGGPARQRTSRAAVADALKTGCRLVLVEVGPQPAALLAMTAAHIDIDVLNMRPDADEQLYDQTLAQHVRAAQSVPPYRSTRSTTPSTRAS